jgi:hypothetical protein
MKHNSNIPVVQFVGISDTALLPKLTLVNCFCFLESDLNNDESVSLGPMLSSGFVQISHFTVHILTEKEQRNIQWVKRVTFRG